MASGSRRKSNSSDSKPSMNKPPKKQRAKLSDRSDRSAARSNAKSNSRSGAGSGSTPRKRKATLKSDAATNAKNQKPRKPKRTTAAYSPSVRYEAKTIAELREERNSLGGSSRTSHTSQAARTQRAIKRAEKRRRAKLPVIIAAIVAALAIIITLTYLIMANTNTFEIEEIEIQGTEHLTGEEVRALVTIPQGTTLLNVDTAQIAASLERDAWVSSVDVVKSFPHKLDIIVHERKIGAIVEVTTGQEQSIQRWAISDDGIWLMVIPSRTSEVGSKLAEQIYVDAEEALHIVGIPYGIDPQIGAHCTDENVNNALEIITGMTTELLDQVKLINAAEAASIVLTLDSNIEIAFGTPDNIREKERICLEIINTKPGVVYINVRVPDRPIWRAA